MDPYQGYKKSSKYLVCIDSDGCVMDTMNIKHHECFGPCLIDTWSLADAASEILTYWNRVNLHSMSRGINRFKALAQVLQMADQSVTTIDGLSALITWVEESSELSEHALQQRLKAAPDRQLELALRWSVEVNRRIRLLPPDQLLPFPGAKEGLAYISQYADTAVVSSANYEAVCEEWHRFGLAPMMNLILAQNAGSKSECIRRLLEFGYQPEYTMMIGDAPGDMEAAKENGVLFYPIITSQEQLSWDGVGEAVQRMMEGNYRGSYQEQKETEFIRNLKH